MNTQTISEQTSDNGTNPALNTDKSFTIVHGTYESDAMKLPRIFAKHSSLQELVSAVIALTGTLAIVASLAACQPKSGANPSPTSALGSPVQVGTPAAGSPPGAPTLGTGARGTGDSGGGNGLKGAFLEAYAFEPWERTDFLNHMTPILTHLREIEPEGQTIGTLMIASKAKRWYLVDASFDRLTNEQIGLGFMQDPTQQLARQSEKEIWFDKRKFEAKPDAALGIANCQDPATRDACIGRARTMGLMHEMLMSAYMMQFMSLDELCKQYSPGTDCSTLVTLNSPEWAAKPKRVLNESDYANIRAMTVYIVDQAIHAANASDLRGEFRKYGFDTRLLRDHIEQGLATGGSNERNSIELDRADFIKALTQATTLGRTPSTCRVARGGNSFFESCPTKFNLIEADGKTNLEVVIEVPSKYGGRADRTYRLLRPIDTYFDKITATRTSLPGQRGTGFSYDLGVAIADDAQVAVGADVFNVQIWLSEDTLSVTGTWLIGKRITAIKQQVSLPGSKFGVAIFEAATPAADVLPDVQIVSGIIEENAKVVVSPSRGDSGLWLRLR